MSLSRYRPAIAAACMGMVLGLPAETNACWLFNCFHSAPAPACPAPVATQVNYVPQTCYRTVYSPVAVTSYRPITTADPCTGCPVTSLSPVTTYVQRPVVVPYTTYRPVVTTVQMPVAPACPCSPCATGACSAAPATTYYAPAAIAAPAPSCGCGGSPVATAAYYARTALAYGAASTSYYPTTFGGSTYSATASYNAPVAATTLAPSASTVAPAFTGAPPATSYYAPSASSVIGPPTTISGPTIISSSPSSTSAITSSSPSSPSTVGSVTTGTPTNTYYNGAPMPGPVNFNSSLNNGTEAGAATVPPSLPPTNNGSTPLQKPAEASPPPEVPPMKPIPNDSTNKGNSTGIFKSETDGRTTGMPMVRPWAYTALYRPHVTLVSAEGNGNADASHASVKTAKPASLDPVIVDVDADAWHAAR